MSGLTLDKVSKTAVITVASFIEMWAAATVCDSMRCQHNCNNGTYNSCKDEYAWAIAIGVISLFLCIVMLIMAKCFSGVGGGVPEIIISGILFIGWFAAMATITMGIPFGNGGGSSNGYFGTWISLIFSWLLLLECAPQLQALVDKVCGTQDTKKILLFIIGMASLIEMWHAAKICDDSSTNNNNNNWNDKGAGDCTEMYGWAVSVGCISLFFALIFGIGPMFMASLEGFVKYVAVFFAMWWLCATVTLTMANRNHPGIFLGIGNGYCGTWVSCFASIALCATCWGGEGILTMGGGGGGGGGSPGVQHDEEQAKSAKL